MLTGLLGDTPWRATGTCWAGPPAFLSANSARWGGRTPSTAGPGYIPAADSARRDDRAYHLARVYARFPCTISTQGAQWMNAALRFLFAAL